MNFIRRIACAISVVASGAYLGHVFNRPPAPVKQKQDLEVTPVKQSEPAGAPAYQPPRQGGGIMQLGAFDRSPNPPRPVHRFRSTPNEFTRWRNERSVYTFAQFRMFYERVAPGARRSLFMFLVTLWRMPVAALGNAPDGLPMISRDDLRRAIDLVYLDCRDDATCHSEMERL